MDKRTVLKQHFGHSTFRPGQEELVDALLSGRDVLGVMPTGAGKSVCYQLPALLLPGVSLVVSPLISLMKDQVTALKQSGIPAAYLNSSLSLEQYRAVLRRARGGAYKILYVAPERLLTDGFLELAQEMELSLLAVDEAHCVSQWGQDFRPSYLSIPEFAARLPKRPVIGAFTATATEDVKADMEKLLRLENPLRVTTGFDRPNLFFEVVRPKNKADYLRSFLAQRAGQSGIVYCSTRKLVESVCGELRGSGIAAARYHAGLEDEERRRSQEDFVYDRVQVMVATNAFGMGIDKSNVSFVVHYNMPKNIESYYQEAGRAGRDGSKARCVLMYSAGDVQTARFLINNASENEALSDQEREQVRQQDLRRLEKMVGYCKTTGCLRAYLLDYFGQQAPERCGSCGNCAGELVQQDITVEAQKILSAVARVERKYRSGLGTALIVRMLHGSKEKRVFQLGLDQLPTYGVMGDVNRMQIRTYIDCLVTQGYLSQTGGEYPVLRLTERAKEVLFHGEKVIYAHRRPADLKKEKKRGEKPSGRSAPAPQGDDSLFETLRALRFRLAQEEKVPAYVVFSNAALSDMAARKPDSMEEFLQVSGVGAVKAARYGAVFLEEISRWQRENGGG